LKKYGNCAKNFKKVMECLFFIYLVKICTSSKNIHQHKHLYSYQMFTFLSNADVCRWEEIFSTRCISAPFGTCKINVLCSNSQSATEEEYSASTKIEKEQAILVVSFKKPCRDGAYYQKERTNSLNCP
jgi:hypothetical protein